jgi:hypothetical protein
MVLFFSFGNLTTEQLSSVVGDVKVIGAAILPGHTVRFGGRSRMHGGNGVAYVSPSPDKDVLGVVFKLRKSQMDLLDLHHECHLGMMQRVSVEVDDGRNEHTALTYILKQGQPRRAVSPAYQEMHKELVHEAFDLYRWQNFQKT